jgi:C1A family cysteine protease
MDQGYLGSCTGHAIAGNVEFIEMAELKNNAATAQAQLIFEAGKFNSVSRLFIYYNERLLEGDPGQDNGAMLRTGVAVMRKYGVCRESIWSYSDVLAFNNPSPPAYAEAVQHKVLISYRISDLFHMKHSLATGNPFVFGIMCYASFLGEAVAKTGVIPMPGWGDSPQGGHALCCVGYDDSRQAFLVRNSWGTQWGIAGYCWIPYAYMTNTNLSDDFWTLRKSP